MAKVGGAAAFVGGVVALFWILPRLGVWFGKVQTGLEPRRTAHFIVYASDPKLSERAGAEAERFVAAFVARWGAKRGFQAPDPPVSIFLFDDHAGLSKHGLLKMGEKLENNGGYFSRGERAVALLRFDDEGLRHELTHMMVALAWEGADLSPWFSEGHAQWHEAGEDGGPPDIAIARCRELVREGKELPLEQVLSADRSAFTSSGNAVVYSESAALFAWLALERKDALERVFELERRPRKTTPSEFAEAVGASLESIEMEWKKWVRQAR